MKQFRLLTGEQLAALELEKDFQQRVVQLARLNKWKIFAIPDSRRASIAGYPDLTLWNPKQKRIIWVELKREKGKTSPVQDEVIEELRQCGAEVYVWRPSDWNIIAETLAKSRK